MSVAAQLGQLATMLIILLITGILLAHTLVRIVALVWDWWDRRRSGLLKRYRRTQEP